MVDLAEKRQAQLAKEQPTEPHRKGVTPVKKERTHTTTPQTDNPPETQYEPLPELNERCGACGESLHYVKMNSRIRKVCCIKHGCTLWREPIRLVSLKIK